MDFALTDDQELIRTAVAKICADYPDEYWAEKDAKHEFPWDFYKTMSGAGWIGIAIPEAYGGRGGGASRGVPPFDSKHLTIFTLFFRKAF